MSDLKKKCQSQKEEIANLREAVEKQKNLIEKNSLEFLKVSKEKEVI